MDFGGGPASPGPRTPGGRVAIRDSSHGTLARCECRAKHEARVTFPDGQTTSATMDRALIIEWIEGEVEAG